MTTNAVESSPETPTHGVRTLRGDPKKAILKLSAPMMVAMVVQALYNLVDGIWVAGLGADALAAIGLFFPFFMIILSLASGIGIGGSSAVSRWLGARTKEVASTAAEHSLVIGLTVGFLLVALSLPFLRVLFRAVGATGRVLELTVQYGRVLVIGAPLVVFGNIANGVLRGEGDTKRAMVAMLLGSGLNIALDPVLIYWLGWGVAGAAWATFISVALSWSIMAWWLFLRRDTYVDIRFRSFRLDRRITLEILRVGLPASFSQLSMAVAMFVLNAIVVKAGGTDGVAVFTGAWRIVMFGLVPLFGIAMGVTAVTGAASGARNAEKLETGYLFGVRVGLLIEAGVSAAILIFAPALAHLFTYSRGAAHISGHLIHAMRILACFLPTVPLGLLTSAMFQGIGRGENSLAVNVLRTLVFQVILSYLMGLRLDLGIEGVWWGIVVGNVAASLISFAWGRSTIHRLHLRFAPTSGSDASINPAVPPSYSDNVG